MDKNISFAIISIILLSWGKLFWSDLVLKYKDDTLNIVEKLKVETKTINRIKRI